MADDEQLFTRMSSDNFLNHRHHPVAEIEKVFATRGAKLNEVSHAVLPGFRKSFRQFGPGHSFPITEAEFTQFPAGLKRDFPLRAEDLRTLDTAAQVAGVAG